LGNDRLSHDRIHRRPNFLERLTNGQYHAAYKFLHGDVFSTLNLLDGKMFAHEAGNVMEIVSAITAFIHYLWNPTWKQGGNHSTAYARQDWEVLLRRACLPVPQLEMVLDEAGLERVEKADEANSKVVSDFVTWLRSHVKERLLTKVPGQQKIKAVGFQKYNRC
jgi:hypothetical protein